MSTFMSLEDARATIASAGEPVPLRCAGEVLCRITKKPA